MTTTGIGTKKDLLRISRGTPAQVGDGFTIRRAIPSAGIEGIDPFLMLDHAGPTPVEPSARPRGVDEHPHKGFETVTVVVQGELEHRDSGGNSGALKPGDVQWMTAGSGLVHEEKYGKEFTRRGGTIEMVQLWVNLPAAKKLTEPGYQDITAESIPSVDLDGGSLRVIAGEFEGTQGAAKTHTHVDLYDLELEAGTELRLARPDGHTTGLYLLRGAINLGDDNVVREGEIAGYGLDGDHITLTVLEPTRALLLGGDPIDEPVASYGPFVMNTMEEIQEALAEYRAGKMGTLS